MHSPVCRLSRDLAQLLVVDIQEKLLPKIHAHERVVAKSDLLIRAARVMDIPVTVSEQYVKGLGPTIAPLAEAAGDAPRFEKMTFSFCDDAACQRRIATLARPQVLLIGIECHVCVLQTALDLLSAGYAPVVIADAVSSRSELDWHFGLERMRSAGAVITTAESAIFEMLRASGTELFKKVLPLVK